MIDLEFIERLIRSMDESSLDSIELERGGTRIRLAKSPPSNGGQVVAAASPAPMAAPQPQAAQSASSAADTAPASGDVESGEDAGPELVEVTSPMVGTFYRSPSPDADPFTSKGAEIGTGDVLCIIEAMKLMNELESEIDGTVREICVEDGEPVEYGQVLFRVEPS